MKSAVAGVAGAVRIKQLTNAGITRAEKHGKREDDIGQARAIYDVPPYTTTGLNLRKLFNAHIKGAFVPKAKARAMHVFVQFPTDLVDGEKAENLVHHARRFIEGVFGSQAIFADRMDRDERGRTGVDVFIAPKYLKKTKHSERVAVGMSVHLKELARKHGHKPNVYGTGRALQDAWHEYLRDEMGLENVQRGIKKQFAGNDHKQAEQLRMEELDARETDLIAAQNAVQDELATIAKQKQDLASLLADAAEAKDIADHARMLQEVDRKAADTRLDQAIKDAAAAALLNEEANTLAAELRAKTAAADQAKLDAESEIELTKAERASAARQERDRVERENAEKVAAMDNQRSLLDEEIANAKADRAIAAKERVDTSSALSDITAIKESLAEEADRAKELRIELENQLAANKSDAAGIADERRALTAVRAVHEAQLALLVRGCDDANGLYLRPVDDGFEMRRERMTAVEQHAYRQPWLSTIKALGVKFAKAMQRIRESALKLTSREQENDERERSLDSRADELSRKDAGQKAAQAEHQSAINALDKRQSELAKKEEQVAKSLIDGAAALESVIARENAAVREHRNWSLFLNEVEDRFDGVFITSSGKIELLPELKVEAQPEILEFLDNKPPVWVTSVVAERRKIFDAQAQATASNAASKELAQDLHELIETIGKIKDRTDCENVQRAKQTVLSARQQDTGLAR